MSIGPGYWVGSSQRPPHYAGSFGIPVRRADGEVAVLTASHVLGGLEASPPAQGTPVDSFGNAGLALAADQRDLGAIGPRIPGARSGSPTVLEIDAGLIRLSPGRTVSNKVGGVIVMDVRHFEFDDVLEPEIAVTMDGAKSGVRSGFLSTSQVEALVKVANLGTASNAGVARALYTHLCEVRAVDGEEFAQSGDSGSVVIDDRGQIVALIVASSDQPEDEPPTAFAVPAWLIFERLGLTAFGASDFTAPY